MSHFKKEFEVIIVPGVVVLARENAGVSAATKPIEQKKHSQESTTSVLAEGVGEVFGRHPNPYPKK